MDNNQANSNDQNNGISGFGGNSNNPSDRSSSATPQQNPAGATGNNPGLVPEQNFTKQSIIGGIEEPKEKSKFSFSIPAILSGKPKNNSQTIPVAASASAQTVPPAPAITPPVVPAVPVVTPPSASVGATPPTPAIAPAAPPPTVTPSYNEVTAPSAKSKFALIAIITGIVLLIAAGAGYYYLTYVNKPEETVMEPIIEEPAPEIIEDLTIDNDPYIIQFTQLEATASARPSELSEHLESINTGNIDQELNIPEVEKESPETTEETEPADSGTSDQENLETPDQP